MNVSELKPGTLLEIYIRRDGYNYKVVSKIEYVDEERVGVSPIASRTRLFRFKESDIVDIVYRVDSKSWKWSNVKAGIASLKDGTKLHVFIPAAKAETFNRRTTYRMPMGIDITLTYEVLETESIVPADRKTKTPEIMLDETLSLISESYREYSCKAYLKDMSEGGAAVASAVQLKKGDIVGFSLPFGEENVVCRAVIVRTSKGNDSLYPYLYGLSYIETSSNYSTFFFTEQRRMLSENRMDYNF